MKLRKLHLKLKRELIKKDTVVGKEGVSKLRMNDKCYKHHKIKVYKSVDIIE